MHVRREPFALRANQLLRGPQCHGEADTISRGHQRGPETHHDAPQGLVAASCGAREFGKAHERKGRQRGVGVLGLTEPFGAELEEIVPARVELLVRGIPGYAVAA